MSGNNKWINYRLKTPYYCDTKNDYISTYNESYPINNNNTDLIDTEIEKGNEKALNILHKHVPPIYDITGKQTNKVMSPIHAYNVLSPKKLNIKSTKNISNNIKPFNIEDEFKNTNNNEYAIKMKELMKKKRSNIPDISYDLDGDGSVSAKELFIAKLFDKNNKGKLTKNEILNARNAIKNGILNDYEFLPNGVKKLTDDDKAIKNGGWIKVKDGIYNNNNNKTLSKVKNERKIINNNINENIYNKYIKHKNKLFNEIPFPYYVHKIDGKNKKIRIKNKENEYKLNEHPISNKILYNNVKSKSELMNTRHNDLIKCLNDVKNKIESSNWIPYQYRKLDKQIEFLKKRKDYKSKKTQNGLFKERNDEMFNIARYWENKKSYKLFDIKKKEANIFKNKIINKDIIDKIPIYKRSYNMYNSSKMLYKNVQNLPKPNEITNKINIK